MGARVELSLARRPSCADRARPPGRNVGEVLLGGLRPRGRRERQHCLEHHEGLPGPVCGVRLLRRSQNHHTKIQDASDTTTPHVTDMSA